MWLSIHSPTSEVVFWSFFTSILLKDGSGLQLAAVNSVWCKNGTLYMFSKSSGNEGQLVLFDENIKGVELVFIDIDYHHPMSLFRGYYHSAAIESSFQWSNQTESSNFLLFPNFQVKKLSVCQAHATTSWQSARKVASLDLDTKSGQQRNKISFIIHKDFVA